MEIIHNSTYYIKETLLCVLIVGSILIYFFSKENGLALLLGFLASAISIFCFNSRELIPAVFFLIMGICWFCVFIFRIFPRKTKSNYK
jgi:hypothetical protein